MVDLGHCGPIGSRSFSAAVDVVLDRQGAGVADTPDGTVAVVSAAFELEGYANGLPDLPATFAVIRDDGRSAKIFAIPAEVDLLGGAE